MTVRKPAAVGLTFVVKEGPKVTVGKITFIGNKMSFDTASNTTLGAIISTTGSNIVTIENRAPGTPIQIGGTGGRAAEKYLCCCN